MRDFLALALYSYAAVGAPNPGSGKRFMASWARSAFLFIAALDPFPVIYVDASKL
ncbi:hypothetical protein [Sphingomonas alba]|uniref:Uncharacterized protein n=1 Tax=Sphingomonas alba TaxID=2908208 RepID=A0ABT0RPH8_9SPHN|nr:hypothetical protein [Sphingomonas alba]MCL6684455.1 hypothetical protein [Sphingomonas alba]